MNIFNLLFKFRGRINRAKYWLAVLVWLAIFAVLAGALALIGVKFELTNGTGVRFAVWVGVISVMAAIVSSFAVGLKRLHDRDKSGWWLAIFYLLPVLIGAIPVMLGSQSAINAAFQLVANGVRLWGFVEIGCLRGTRGHNRFGVDPLQKEAMADVFQ